MPPSVAIPVGLGIAGLISGNAQQKAAIKNNENQQNAAVQNANDASAAGLNQYNQYLAAHHSPLDGLMMGARPTGMNPGQIAPAQNVNASSLFAPQGMGQGQGQGMPQVFNLQALIASMMRQYAPPTQGAGQAPQAPPAASQGPMQPPYGGMPMRPPMNAVHPIVSPIESMRRFL